MGSEIKSTRGGDVIIRAGDGGDGGNGGSVVITADSGPVIIRAGDAVSVELSGGIVPPPPKLRPLKANAGGAVALSGGIGGAMEPALPRPEATAKPPLIEAAAKDEQPPAFSAEAKALAILVKHPEWTDTRIAREAECSRASLYRWPTFIAARAAMKAGKQERPSIDDL